MKIELHLARATYVQGEQVNVDVSLINTGTGPVMAPLPGEPANWQPEYSLSGPGMSQPSAFSYRSVRFKNASHDGAKLVVETLAPGKEFAHGFTLNEWQDLSKPGAYTLRCRLDWNGLKAEAQPLNFEIAANRFVGAAAAAAEGVAKSRDLSIAWLGEGAGGKSKNIGRTIYILKRPDLGELALRDLRLLRTAPAAASEAVAISTNFDPADVSLLRFGWKEGDAVLFGAGLDSDPARVELGASAHVIQPALATRDGRVRVFALSGQRLSAATFTERPAGPVSLDGHAAAVGQLPLPAIGAVAALGPEGLGSRGHIVAVGDGNHGAVLMHWMEGGSVTAVDVPEAAALQSSRPAIHIDPNGTIHTAAIVRRAGALALVTASFSADGSAAGAPQVLSLRLTADSVESAAAAFESASEAAGSPFWAAALKSGRIASTTNPRAARFHKQPALRTGDFVSHATVRAVDRPREGAATISVDLIW